ncbi:LemA protein [Dongia mobilis]|uniref:LemA protein n=1 Tax=Dongia mobilis TaxID=578943 RepID=A0A4R6WQ63_9PROT|nr:LemA family protein [Dongia mobilis]TDQ81324.1 LemA protein [Dongia mobilis]
MRIVGFVILGLVIAVLVWAATGINAIPTKEENAGAAWAQVLNQYQRRAELVPNLVAVVKGAAEFEKSTLESVVEARSRVGSMQVPADILTNPEAMRSFDANQGALTSALSRLLVVVEQYPNLKATEGFQTLQAQLEGTENRIAVARRDFIEAVRSYNTELKTFPGVLWKNLLYQDRALMQQLEVEPAKMEVPMVDFGAGNSVEQ